METFDGSHDKTSGPADCVARNIREFRRSHLLARISSRVGTPSIAGSHLGAARRGAEGARAEQRSTFKLLLSYRGFYCANNKSCPPSAGLSAFHPPPPTCVWRFVIAAKYGRYLYYGASPTSTDVFNAGTHTRQRRATWDFVTPRSCIIKGR